MHQRRFAMAFFAIVLLAVLPAEAREVRLVCKRTNPSCAGGICPDLILKIDFDHSSVMETMGDGLIGRYKASITPDTVEWRNITGVKFRLDRLTGQLIYNEPPSQGLDSCSDAR